MRCGESIRRTLAVIHGAQAPQPLIGLPQWVTAKVFSCLNPAELNGYTRKTISDQNKIVPALCFDNFLTTGDLDAKEASNAGSKAFGTNQASLFISLFG